jgi:hypothetical protein
MLLTVLLLLVLTLAFCAYTAFVVSLIRADLDEKTKQAANSHGRAFWEEEGRAQDLTDNLQ